MPRPLNIITHGKSVTLIASQGTILAVVVVCDIVYVHGDKELLFTICKRNVKCK